MAKGILHIVPTPVGNLEDMSFRAVRILSEADIILAEDTRTSAVLLQHYNIKAKLLSHHKFNEHQSAETVCRLLMEGKKVALISDAGTPGISDPGFFLARACAQAGIQVCTLPGATACIPAIVSSGLPCDRFCFEGFLPQKKGRKTLLDLLTKETRTMIFYESPKRLVKTLEQFVEVFGADRPCCVSREISKLYEQHHRGTLSEVLSYFQSTEPKGEIVITLAGLVEQKGEHKNKYRNHDETEGEASKD